ncbi:hypothetical protein [uncultured Leifsonia sp.]|uniref:hypothetical protein n=1 Tax=uncultured Leifsonia sp. TaxID=340359 RepID=UPI0025E86647|nr:hypothetical protein [uncultured Leifsonia sp.]
MNQYGTRIEDHWRRVAPTQYRQIEDPETYFTELGEEMLTVVDQLQQTLAGPDRQGESYLEKVGRLNAARKQAEEVAWENLVTVQPEQTDAEVRENWAATQPSLDSLADWAEATRDGADWAKPIEMVAEEWMLDRTFLQHLVEQEQPYTFLLNSTETLQQSEAARFARWKASTPQ